METRGNDFASGDHRDVARLIAAAQHAATQKNDAIHLAAGDKSTIMRAIIFRAAEIGNDDAISG